MGQKKRILSIVVLLCVVLFSMFTVTSFAATTVTISLSKYDQAIPETTTLLTSGVVQNATPTYRVIVKATITGGNSSLVGRKLTFNNPNTTNVKLIPNSATTIQLVNGSYTAYATYEVRGTNVISCTASINDGTFSGSVSSSITPSVACGYTKSFLITYYITAKESDYTGTRTTAVTGITGLYKSAFIAAVKFQGSGYSEDGKYVQWVSGDTYKFVTAPSTATGTVPTVGRTIAVEAAYVPRLTATKAKVTIGAGIGARQAEDGGQQITGWHIDVYYGVGKPTTVPVWSNTNQSVYYNGNNLY